MSRWRGDVPGGGAKGIRAQYAARRQGLYIPRRCSQTMTCTAFPHSPAHLEQLWAIRLLPMAAGRIYECVIVTITSAVPYSYCPSTLVYSLM